MKSKQEILALFEKVAYCIDIHCEDCPFYDIKNMCNMSSELVKLGAKEMLKTLSEKVEE